MTLVPGTRLGAYDITGLLGTGGMGEVYRARDPRLQRDVAIKILPEIFASDPERLARFEREAQVLASLNHPHIAQIYGVEESSGVRALVMELVDGETLADRIARGAMPLDEALPIARQIAEALEAAHEQGIIHRDLKPANIKVRDDGTVKVLDFGLAKLAAPAAAAVSPQTLSPTITSPVLATGVGVLLGTAAYMSPEQAKGKDADKRSDVWAFGCVLYEMLTGKRAFEGEDVSDTLAAVLRGDPDWSALSADVQPLVRTLIGGCLERDRRRRIGDLSVAVFVLGASSLAFGASSAMTTPATSRPAWRRPMAYVLAGVVGAVGVGSFVAARRPQPDVPVTRFTLPLGPEDVLTNAGRHVVAVSRDGRRIVYAANDRLYLRSLDQLEATPIRGIEGTSQASPREPFFSPDGQWVGFWANGQLKKIATAGGAPVVLCAALLPFGAHWDTDGNILYGQGNGGIWRVSANGGAPEKIVSVAKGEFAHGPQMLPGGHALLFTLAHGAADWDDADIVVQRLDTGKKQVVLHGGTDARYVPTGHLLYALRGTVLAVPFDAANGRPNGGPVPVLEQVAQPSGPTSGAVHFSVSDAGTLVYVREDTTSILTRTLMWVDRRGREIPLNLPARAYQYARLSPDGSRIAVDIAERNRDIWIWDMRRATLTRLTSNTAADQMPVWTPDGQRVIFSSGRDGYPNLYAQVADGTADAERLFESADFQFPSGVTSDGSRVLVRGTVQGQHQQLFVLEIAAKPHRLEPLVTSAFNEYNPVVSPDGRWVAYASDESGQEEIYVRPFPATSGGRWQVSAGGGRQPLWSHNGRELFYRSLSGAFMRVGINNGPEWTATTPSLLFEGRSYLLGGPAFARTFDLSLDDSQFLVIKGAESTSGFRLQQPLIVVQNWFGELKARVPAK